MLADLMVHAASLKRTPPRFRPHLRDAVRYLASGRRQARAWAPHLANARGLIDTTIDDLPRRRSVAVLGSGPLFDIPLESLARTFSRVILVDRIHLSAIDRRLARYGNVELWWRDLGEGLGLLAEITDLDWVISSAVVGALAAAVPGRERQAVDSHLDGLAALACPATLIADLDYRVFNRHGVVLESADLMYGRPVPRTGLRWKWEIAPFGESGRNTRRVHYMAAWPDWRVTD